MILFNTRTTDKEDVAVLFHAILRYAEANEERLDRSIASVGYSHLLEVAEHAATEIALQHKEQGDSWDGVVWFELLECIDEESLAESLFEDQGDIASTVEKWLATFEA